mmetsp:Transcript_83783/g.191228  ORF Transcript_83783/g.191228 Transcript_83783/m.191228 type:complete len:218 (+) Transcript_83783:1024-1677(+)
MSGGGAEGTWSDEAEEAFQAATLRFAKQKNAFPRIVKFVRSKAEGITRRDVEIRAKTMRVEEALAAGDFPAGPPPWAHDTFDHVLLDGPCSAMGQKPLLNWDYKQKDVEDHAAYQRAFLVAAAKLVKVGGTVTYSTCSVTIDENEGNVRWALDNLPLKLVDAREGVVNSPMPGLRGWAGCGVEEEHLDWVLRFDPEVFDLGFFCCKFVKTGPCVRPV